MVHGSLDLPYAGLSHEIVSLEEYFDNYDAVERRAFEGEYDFRQNQATKNPRLHGKAETIIQHVPKVILFQIKISFVVTQDLWF